jgi:hypothetical protein
MTLEWADKTKDGLNPMASTGVLGSGFGGAVVGHLHLFFFFFFQEIIRLFTTCLDF